METGHINRRGSLPREQLNRNKLYHVLSWCLFGHQHRERKVRNDVTQFMLEHPDLYKNHCTDGFSIPQIVEAIRSLGEWDFDLEIQAVCDKYQCGIVLWKTVGRQKNFSPKNNIARPTYYISLTDGIFDLAMLETLVEHPFEAEEVQRAVQFDLENVSVYSNQKEFYWDWVEEEGGSLFRALALMFDGREDKAEDYRTAAIVEVMGNKAVYTRFCHPTKPGYENIICFVATLRNKNWTPGYLEFMALARALRIRLHVHEFGAQKPALYAFDANRPDVHILKHRCHFFPFWPKETLQEIHPITDVVEEETTMAVPSNRSLSNPGTGNPATASISSPCTNSTRYVFDLDGTPISDGTNECIPPAIFGLNLMEDFCKEGNFKCIVIPSQSCSESFYKVISYFQKGAMDFHYAFRLKTYNEIMNNPDRYREMLPRPRDLLLDPVATYAYSVIDDESIKGIAEIKAISTVLRITIKVHFLSFPSFAISSTLTSDPCPPVEPEGFISMLFFNGLYYALELNNSRTFTLEANYGQQMLEGNTNLSVSDEPVHDLVNTSSENYNIEKSPHHENEDFGNVMPPFLSTSSLIRRPLSDNDDDNTFQEIDSLRGNVAPVSVDSRPTACFSTASKLKPYIAKKVYDSGRSVYSIVFFIPKELAEKSLIESLENCKGLVVQYTITYPRSETLRKIKHDYDLDQAYVVFVSNKHRTMGTRYRNYMLWKQNLIMPHFLLSACRFQQWEVRFEFILSSAKGGWLEEILQSTLRNTGSDYATKPINDEGLRIIAQTRKLIRTQGNVFCNNCKADCPYKESPWHFEISDAFRQTKGKGALKEHLFLTKYRIFDTAIPSRLTIIRNLQPVFQREDDATTIDGRLGMLDQAVDIISRNCLNEVVNYWSSYLLLIVDGTDMTSFNPNTLKHLDENEKIFFSLYAGYCTNEVFRTTHFKGGPVYRVLSNSCVLYLLRARRFSTKGQSRRDEAFVIELLKSYVAYHLARKNETSVYLLNTLSEPSSAYQLDDEDQAKINRFVLSKTPIFRAKEDTQFPIYHDLQFPGNYTANRLDIQLENIETKDFDIKIYNTIRKIQKNITNRRSIYESDASDSLNEN